MEVVDLFGLDRILKKSPWNMMLYVLLKNLFCPKSEWLEKAIEGALKQV